MLCETYEIRSQASFLAIYKKANQLMTGKHNSNISRLQSLCSTQWAGRLAWLGRWLYEPKVAGSSPARPTIWRYCAIYFGCSKNSHVRLCCLGFNSSWRILMTDIHLFAVKWC